MDEYTKSLKEQFKDLKINLVKHDTSPTGMPAYIEVHLGKSAPKDKGSLVLDLGNYIHRITGLSYQMTPEFRGRGKTTTIRWFMTWSDIAPVIPNIFAATGKAYLYSTISNLPLEFNSLIIQDSSRGVMI